MDTSAFAELSPCTFSDVVTRDRVMDHGIRPLWPDMPRIAGPAYPVRCAPGDNLMLHAAIHRAPAGAIIVVQAGDNDYAQSGGNVCATAQQNGVAGFVVDGVVRDVAEVRASRFPVFARGIVPIPGTKSKPGVLNGPIVCGGVTVEPGDVVVADEEGIVVLPRARAEEILEKAQAKAARDAATTLDAWQKDHRARIDKALRDVGMAG
jgi:4-hydroxy-4-methyl-2-oxoglutarate aldolase